MFYYNDLKPVVQKVWNQLFTYWKDQKLSITGMTYVPEGALDGLNKM